MTSEFAELLAHVKQDAPLTAMGVKKSIESYFKTKVVWSLLKDEYEHHMNDAIKARLCEQILDRINGGAQ